MILQLASMRQPLTAAGSLNLINSMIQSNNLQDEVAAWKKKHNISGENDNSQQLGQKYWQNFKKQHPEIYIKKAIQFDSKGDDWCIYENFQKMYDGVYSEMVRSRVAIQVPNKVFVMLDGRITENKQESVGRETNFLLTRLECIFFVDGFGCNTSHKSDGNVGGQKFAIDKTKRALI